MNSNLKLLSAGLLVAVLAGCGGGGGGTTDTTDPAPTTPTCSDGYALDQSTNECVETAENAAADDKAEADAKALIAKAKALKTAIADGAGVAATRTSIPAIGTGDDATVAITMEAGDATGSLGSWAGMNYSGKPVSGDSEATGMALVYSNADAAKSYRFDSEQGEAIHGLTRTAGDPAGDYTVPVDAANANIGGFPTIGKTSYDEDDEVMGTFMSASGTYMCTEAAGCTAVAGDSTSLTGVWTFTPNPGAMVMQMDNQYLHYGWWLRSDGDGPTHAGVLYGEILPDGGTPTLVTGVNNAALVGKATYNGKAAGKFAISDPLRPSGDDAGHFTANAVLNADFKAADSTLSGTIDAFRLNDGSSDPGWSVELQATTFDSTDNMFDTNDTPDGDQTVWSIGDGSGAASGRWEAQMFDEDGSDGSNVPTSVVGSFSSSIGTTHSMVGAFGAER